MQYLLHTFGCQMNKSRSEHLAFLLQKAGYREAPPGERADLLLFNTCAVRDHAVHKAISVINGYIAGYRGGDLPVVVVFGCLAELIREELVRRVPAVRVVAGTRNIDDIPRLIRESEGRRAPVLSFNAAATDPFREPGYRRKPGLSTFLPVTYGCDNFCSYCVVPYTTGRQTSKSLNLIRQELAAIQAEGFREVVLLGQNVNSYGTDLVPAASFAALLTAVDEQLRGSGVWIRFLTSHPRDLRRDIVDLVRASAVICPYFHFPLQSGSDRILRAMNRGYVRESYLDMVHYIRQAIPEAGIGTDIIVGFPGETDRDFQDTLAVAREAEFEIAYTYTYSPRPHTAAGRIIDDVPPEVKKERLLVLNELVYSLYLDKIGRLVGKVSSVLVEHNGGKPAGKTPGNLQVCLSENGTLQLGQVSRVLFQEVRSGRLMGTVLADEP